jgi:hypothetical protein
VGFAVGGEAVGGVGFVIDLEAWGTVIVEGAAQAEVFVGFLAVVVQGLAQGEAGLDFGDFHV